MNYFCANCQKRHPAEDIAADMWSICKEDVRRGLVQITDHMQETFRTKEDIKSLIVDLNDNLMAFINQNDAQLDDKLRSLFALDRQAMSELHSKRKNGRIVSGTYSIRLNKLYMVYVQLAKNKDTEMINSISQHDLQKWFDVPLCSMDVKVLLDENGIFEAITDSQNGHFERDNKKLGFRRICSHCGRVLSSVAGCAEEIVVALAGSPRAGKTSCMVAMMSSLQDQHCAGASIGALGNDETMAKISEELEYYKRCQKVTKTADDQVAVPTYSMLLTLRQKQGNDAEEGVETKRVLTIADMPGEFWQDGDGLTEEFFRQYSGLYMNIDCIWFVTSKATIRLSQSDIPDHVKNSLKEDTSEDADVIYKASPSRLEGNLSRLKQHMEANGKKIPPILMIVSKPDFIVSDVDRVSTQEYEIFPLRGNVLTRNADEIMDAVRGNADRRFLGIMEKHMFNHSRNVRDYIKTCNAHFLGAVENNCPDRFYMAVSAYGQPALKPEQGSKNPTPYHELYPLFWTLMITGATRVYHKTQWQKKGFFGGIASTENVVEGVRYRYDKVDMLLANAKTKQKRKDLEVIYQDIENNLMTHRESYSESVINHPRE